MAIYHIYKQSIYRYYKILIDYLISQRKTEINDNLRIAINLNIILATACYIEGFLENITKSIVTYYKDIFQQVKIPEFEIRKPTNTFFNAMLQDLGNRISRCTGIESYNEYFKMLLGESIHDDVQINDSIEAINVLFQLRNVIAHGREISAYEQFSSSKFHEGEEFFFGGYKNAETLLLREKIISTSFIKGGGVNELFTDDVADYFIKKMEKFVSAVETFVSDRLVVQDFMEVFVSEYNKLHGTNYTVDNFFENVSITVKEHGKHDE